MKDIVFYEVKRTGINSSTICGHKVTADWYKFESNTLICSIEGNEYTFENVISVKEV
jgi:hypothetical protein